MAVSVKREELEEWAVQANLVIDWDVFDREVVAPTLHFGDDGVTANADIAKDTILYQGEAFLHYDLKGDDDRYIQAAMMKLDTHTLSRISLLLRRAFPRHDNDDFAIANAFFQPVLGDTGKSRARECVKGITRVYDEWTAEERKHRTPLQSLVRKLDAVGFVKELPKTISRQFVFYQASRFNHACYPNGIFQLTPQASSTNAILTIRAARDIAKGQECTILYYKNMADHPLARQSFFRAKAGVLCMCDSCIGLCRKNTRDFVVETENVDASHFCLSCGCPAPATQKLLACAKCRRVRYCSKTCQKAHWEFIHRQECQVLLVQKLD